MSFFQLSLVMLVIASTAYSQCTLYTTAELGTVLSGATITGEPNTVCLAAAPLRDTYREASVVVTVNGELRQVELSCSSGNTWEVTTNNPASANESTALRRDCGTCVASSVGDATFDNIAHCSPCLSTCTGLRQCTSFQATGCCNVYNNDTCALTCPAGTEAAASTGYSCIDPCSNNPCRNNGSCSASGVDFSCTCVGSWSGTTCQTCDVADCTVCSQVRDVCSQCRSGLKLLASGACGGCTLDCGSGGVLDDVQCRCNCRSGYTGDMCARDCKISCGSGGILDQSECRCDCKSGFTGDMCGIRCDVENCQRCSNSSLDTCEVCIDGYKLEADEKICSRSGFVGPLSLGALIGIIIAAVAVLLVILVVVCLCCFFLCCKSGSNSKFV